MTTTWVGAAVSERAARNRGAAKRRARRMRRRKSSIKEAQMREQQTRNKRAARAGDSLFRHRDGSVVLPVRLAGLGQLGFLAASAYQMAGASVAAAVRRLRMMVSGMRSSGEKAVWATTPIVR